MKLKAKQFYIKVVFFSLTTFRWTLLVLCTIGDVVQDILKLLFFFHQVNQL